MFSQIRCVLQVLILWMLIGMGVLACDPNPFDMGCSWVSGNPCGEHMEGCAVWKVHKEHPDCRFECVCCGNQELSGAWCAPSTGIPGETTMMEEVRSLSDATSCFNYSYRRTCVHTVPPQKERDEEDSDAQVNGAQDACTDVSETADTAVNTVADGLDDADAGHGRDNLQDVSAMDAGQDDTPADAAVPEDILSGADLAETQDSEGPAPDAEQDAESGFEDLSDLPPTICIPHESIWCSGQHLFWFDSCGNQEDKAEDCDGCVCMDSSCLEPGTCITLGKQCGMWDNGCGKKLDCGECPPSMDCTSAGSCIVVPVCPPYSSANCTLPNGCPGTSTCSPDGSLWSACEPIGTTECAPSQMDITACGQCGERVRSCAANCTWGAWGPCEGEGQCVPYDTEIEDCGNCGTRSRMCGADCAWKPWNGCQNQGVCFPGEEEEKVCENCGTQARMCSDECIWDAWSSCAGQGACAAGSAKSCTTQTGCVGAKTCSFGCVWSLCEPVFENKCGGCTLLDKEPGTWCGLDLPGVWEHGCYVCDAPEKTMCEGQDCAACAIGCWGVQTLGCWVGGTAVCAAVGLGTAGLGAGLCALAVEQICGAALDTAGSCKETCHAIGWCPKIPCAKK